MCNFSKIATVFWIAIQATLVLFQHENVFLRSKSIRIKLADSSTLRVPFHKVIPQTRWISFERLLKIWWKIGRKLLLTLSEVIKFMYVLQSVESIFHPTQKKSSKCPANSGRERLSRRYILHSRNESTEVYCATIGTRWG